MNDSYNNINIEKLNNSLMAIKTINSSLENTDISKYFIDIESILRKVNFEHGNCISNYRDEINLILDKLTILKENLASLENSISITIEEFSTVEHRQVLNENSSASITKIPPATTEQPVNQVQETTQTNNEINTVPIGLGIAAAGIAGSVGAVVLDSMKDKENYQPPKDEPIIEEYEQTEENHEDDQEEPVFVDAGSYHASRDGKEQEKFYGTVIPEYDESEDSENNE